MLDKIDICKEIKNMEQVKKADLLIYVISKSEVINNNFDKIKRSIAILNKAKKWAKCKIMLTFDEYEDDQREIYEIPEIRKYVKKIWEECNHIFYFLTTIEHNNSVIYACINDFESVKINGINKTALHILENEKIRKNTIESMAKYGVLINDVDGVREILASFI